MKTISKLMLAGSLVIGSSVAIAQSASLGLAPAADQPTLASDTSRPFEIDAVHAAKTKQSETPSNVYIVQLADPALATYAGGIGRFLPTSPKITGAKRLDAKSAESRAYEGYLRGQQAEFARACDAALGRSVEPRFVYRHAFNGMALELHAKEAELLRKLPGVVKVERERIEMPTTDVGPLHIRADAIWNNHPAHRSSRGEGIVIAVLDTGINHDHPSFADIGGDGYNHTNPLGSGNYVPGSYCDTNPGFCNDKLIGAWTFVRGPSDPNSPEDSDGHGSHTAGTAAGNVIPNAVLPAPTTNFNRAISGVAPHANLIMYDVCIDTCPGSALLAAINQVVIDAAALPDGIHSLNYSISGGNDPYNDAVELGFLNATAAGVYVSASAGNAGPGASTTGHNSPWVATTAALTHPRQITNTLSGLTSSGGNLMDIVGAGLTSGYGPAAIVHASSFPTSNGSNNDVDPGQCLDPFPAGTWNGQIVICDRGTIARVGKGANVLAGGAGGFVLANLAANGESINGDPHFLPAVHVGFSDGQVLSAWVATNSNTMATIGNHSVILNPAAGDIVASFSSRGPNGALEILVPDLGAPGVDIYAPYRTDGVAASPEYTFLSGTSMSSPHNAGAGALLNALTDWTPYEIRSALMMTAKRTALNIKEDGVTPADAFDVGAGRIDLDRAKDSGLVLDESPANFANADPELGGDPKTLNIASMQNNQCVENCSWTRTVRRVGGAARYDLSVTGPTGLGLTVTPSKLTLGNNKTAQVTVTANTLLAGSGWNFAELQLAARGQAPDLHMPIAVLPSNTQLPGVFSHTVDSANAVNGDTLGYTLRVTNGQLGGPLTVSAVLPSQVDLVAGSLAQVITNGSTSSPFTYNAGTRTVSWSGSLAAGGLNLAVSPAPFGFFPLASLGVAPFGCPGDCDDGGFLINVPSFVYNGQSYSSVIWSVNGTLEAGTASGLAASASNQNLPSPVAPNNLMAPFWTDLNMGVNGDGAEWYVAVLNAGPRQFTVYEWSNIPLFGNPANRYSFQIWVQNGTSGNIWFVYGALGPVNTPSGVTVGVENSDGTVGASRFFEGVGIAPTAGSSVRVNATIGGTATLTYQANAARCAAGGTTLVSRGLLNHDGTNYRAVAATRCTQ